MLIESFLDELNRFEYSDEDPDNTTFNGRKAPNKDVYHGEYYQKVLLPLSSDFQTGLGQFQITQGIQGVPKEALISQLESLPVRIQSVIDVQASRLEIAKWQTLLQEALGSSSENNGQKVRSLKFLIDATSAQSYFARDAKAAVEQLIHVLKNPIRPPELKKSEEEKILKFQLTAKYSKPAQRGVLSDLRRSLIFRGFLSKNDNNNTIGNFRKFFFAKNESATKDVANPIKWLGNQTELKYFIYMLTDLLIEQNFTENSNYYTAFQLFTDKDGNMFKPSEVRYKGDIPATAKELDSIVSSLKISDTKV